MWPMGLHSCRTMCLLAGFSVLAGVWTSAPATEHRADADSSTATLSRLLTLSLLGDLRNVSIVDPEMRVLTMKCAGIPGGRMSQTSFFKNPVVTIEIESPLEGLYVVSGVAQDSTALGLNADVLVDAQGRCTLSGLVRLSKGERFKRCIDYHRVGRDSCMVSLGEGGR